MLLPIILSVTTIVFLYLFLYTYSSMLTSLCLLFYSCFSTYNTKFTFFNYISIMYIYSFVYIVDYDFSNYTVTISTPLLILLAVSSLIIYFLHLFFYLRCQLCLFDYIFIASTCLLASLAMFHLITQSLYLTFYLYC